MKAKGPFAIYTAAHFCVDFACFCMLFGQFSPGRDTQALAVGFLLYNAMAFGLQPLIGWLYDTRIGVNPALVGCLLVLVGLFFPLDYVSLAVCALGNAFFHIGGGIDSLVNSGGAMTRSGVFVSSGALGVALGTLFGRSEGYSPLLPAVMLAVCATAAAAVCGGRVSPAPAYGFSRLPARSDTAVLWLCFASIAVRSYVGFTAPSGWKQQLPAAAAMIAAALCAALGKAAGGAISDRIGARRAGVWSLLLSLPLLVFGSASPLLACAGLLLFNMTMAVTLCATAAALPGSPGLAFGLTTLALLCGYLPTAFFILPEAVKSASAAVLILISAVCIYFALTNHIHEREKLA